MYSSIELTNLRQKVQVSSPACCRVQLKQLHCRGGTRCKMYSSIELTNPRGQVQVISPGVKCGPLKMQR
jgi:hypothetical protein